MQRPLHSRRVGFTLIEIMIVISIIAILAAILVPNYVRSRAQGIVTACKTNLKNIATAMEMYGHDNLGRYPTVITGIIPTYLKILPTCPSIAATTYLNGYGSASSPDAYTVVCSGNNHPGVGYTANYPQYTSVQGLQER